MEDRDDFFVHVDSTSSFDFFPNNKISDFRTKLITPIELEHNTWQVGLTECSYISPDIIFGKGELIATTKFWTGGKNVPLSFSKLGSERDYTTGGIRGKINAPHDFKSFESLLQFLRELFPSKLSVMKIVNDYLEVTRDQDYEKEAHHSIFWSEKLENMLGWQDGYIEVSVPDKLINTTISITGNSRVCKCPLSRIAGDPEIVIGMVQSFDLNDVVGLEILDELKLRGFILDWKIVQNQIQIWRTDDMIEENDEIKFNTHMKKMLGLEKVQVMPHLRDDVKILMSNEKIKTLFIAKGDLMVEIILQASAPSEMRSQFGQSREEIINKVKYLVKNVTAPTDFWDWKELIDYIAKVANCAWTTNYENITFLFPSDIHCIRKFYGNTAVYTGFQNGQDVTPGKYQKLNRIWTGKHKIFPNVGNTRLYVYSDVIETQYVGDTYAPLLRAIPMDEDRGKTKVHYFDRPYYLALRMPTIEMIHMYIRNENGEAPAFELGSFASTLHFKRRS